MNRTELGRAIYQTAHITGSFLLRSGVTSDQYFDKYLFESDPTLLAEIVRQMAALIPDGTQRLAGLELGGVPLATALSLETGIPGLFVRKEAKQYGTCKMAEGTFNPGDAITVVEDIVTSGGQALLSATQLRDQGFEVKAILCVIDREAGGEQAINEAGFRLAPLFKMSELAG